MTSARLIAALCLACLAASPVQARAQDAPGLADFERGLAAYRAGDYGAARSGFESARAQGFDNPNLWLDLGLADYRLGRQDEARAAFERLRAFPGFEGVADFHLGLVAARSGDRRRAAELWQRLAADAPDVSLRERSRIALSRLGAGAQARTPSAYLLAALGRDTNPALLDESLQPNGATSSEAELFGAVDYPVAGSASHATVLHGGGYLTDYFVDNGLDQSGLFAGLSRERERDGRRRAVSLDASANWLGGEPFADVISLGAQGMPAHGGGLTLRGQASHIDAAPVFSYLDGWRVRAEAEVAGPPRPKRWRADYQAEFNDRADLAAGGEFFSHSAIRQRVSVALEHPLGERWQARWVLRYRNSRYRDPNRFLQNGVMVEQRRVENLLQAGVQARRRITTGTDLLLEYEYSHNTASIDVFAYERHVALVGLEWMPRWP